ncbi:MAG: phosphoribosylformylglycinamidine cyclo-ligase [bacterium]
MNYKTAGVDLEAGDRAKKNIAELARRTHNEQVLRGLGLFGGFFQFPQQNFREPVLVSSIDGVGTKIKIASRLHRYRGLGHDIVHHCLNDIMVGGADPLFFLDYLAFGKLQPEIVRELAEGMSQACVDAGCALIGGETAEMPDLYQTSDFDLAGTMVGVAEKSKIIDGSAIHGGEVLIGVASSGLHTNGYSLVRKIIANNVAFTLESYHPDLGETVGEALLRPHRSYQVVIRALRELEGVAGFSHVTGGGLLSNTQRLLRGGLALNIDWQAWKWPPLFKLIRHYGKIEKAEMQTVFNLGIGLVVVVAPAAVDLVQSRLRELHETFWLIGEVGRT